MSLGTSAYLCLLWIRTHLDLPSDIFCVFEKVVWKTLEVIYKAASDTSQLTDCDPSPVTLSDPAAQSFLPSCSTLVVTASSDQTFVKTDVGSAEVMGVAVCLLRDSSTILFLKEVCSKDNPAIVFYWELLP